MMPLSNHELIGNKVVRVRWWGLRLSLWNEDCLSRGNNIQFFHIGR